MTPRMILIVLLLVSVLGAVSAQAQRKQPVTDNLYSRALLAAMEANERAYGGKDSSRDYRKAIVMRNPEITDDLPVELKSYKFEYVYPQELIDRYKKVKARFPFLEIGAIQNEGEKIIINIVERWVDSGRNRKPGFALSDGTKVTFRYDCERHSFVIEDVHLWGV